MKNNANSTHRLLLCLTTVWVFFGCAVFSAAVAQPVTTSQKGLIVPGDTPVLVSRQFIFTEGASVDKAGNIFFTDQPNNKIWEYDTNGKLSLFMDSAGRSNGSYFDAKGNLVTCADEHNEIWRISPQRKVTVLVKDYNGHVLNGPNDLWIDAHGGMYFTDPYFQRDYWARTSPDPGMPGDKVYYVAPGTQEPVLTDTSIKKPNGIVGTPDGKYLYVADMGVWKTFKYNINKDGTLSNKQLFANEASDGMTLDEQGNVYLTNQGVSIYNPQGRKIAHIAIPEKWVGNICFGGKDKKLLFMTASQGIYILKMMVKGVE